MLYNSSKARHTKSIPLEKKNQQNNSSHVFRRKLFLNDYILLLFHLIIHVNIYQVKFLLSTREAAAHSYNFYDLLLFF